MGTWGDENGWDYGQDDEELFELAMHPEQYRSFKSGKAKADFEADLAKCSEKELESKLAMVKTNSELTDDEKDANIDLINFALNGGVHHTREDVLEDIMEQEQAETKETPETETE